jgi:chromosome segregation ATPase
MAQLKDVDIRDIKTSIDALTRTTDANTQAIQSSLKSLETISRVVENLATSFTDLREETRVGFAHVDTNLSDIRGDIKVLESKIDNVETNLTTKIDNVETNLTTKIDHLDSKIVEVDKKVEKLDKKLDSQESRLWAFGVVVFSILATALFRVTFFPVKF